MLTIRNFKIFKISGAITTVLAGSIIAQLIPVVASLIITKIFAPSAFGLYSTWLGIITLISIILTFRFEKTFVLLQRRKDKTIGLATTTTIIVFNTAILSGISITFTKVFDLGYGEAEILLICIGGALTATSNSLLTWISSSGLFKVYSYLRITQTFTIALFQILFGLISSSSFYLLFGYIIGQIITSTFCFFYVTKHIAFPRKNVLKRGLHFISKYQAFPTFSLPADLMNATSALLPLLFIAKFYGAYEAGIYALAIKVVGAPCGLIGASVLEVFRREAALEKVRVGNCAKSYKETFKLLLYAGLLVFGLLYILSEKIFVFFYGTEWSEASRIVICLLPLFCMRLLASPLSYVVYIFDKQYVDLIWQIILLAGIVASFLLTEDFYLSLYSYAYVYSTMYVIYCYKSAKIAWNNQ